MCKNILVWKRFLFWNDQENSTISIYLQKKCTKMSHLKKSSISNQYYFRFEFQVHFIKYNLTTCNNHRYTFVFYCCKPMWTGNVGLRNESYNWPAFYALPSGMSQLAKSVEHPTKKPEWSQDNMKLWSYGANKGDKSCKSFHMNSKKFNFLFKINNFLKYGIRKMVAI